MAIASTTTAMDASESGALARDAADPLARFRQRFYLLPGRIYLDGNSLGLLSRDAEAETLRALEQWKSLAIGGWLEADPPWFTLGEELGALVASLIGAEPDAVVVTGGTTVNQHALTATFYRPQGARRKIVATALDFPSDVYALQSLIRLHGGDPNRDLVLVPSHDGRIIAEEDIVAALREDVALALLPAVLYRSPGWRPRRGRVASRSASTAPTPSARRRIGSTSGASTGPSGAPTSSSTPDQARPAGCTSTGATGAPHPGWPAGGATPKNGNSTWPTPGRARPRPGPGRSRRRPC
jgi:hypothetical protein